LHQIQVGKQISFRDTQEVWHGSEPSRPKREVQFRFRPRLAVEQIGDSLDGVELVLLVGVKFKLH
jgi:hypothetical protein